VPEQTVSWAKPIMGISTNKSQTSRFMMLYFKMCSKDKKKMNIFYIFALYHQ